MGAHVWPKDLEYRDVVFEPEDRSCAHCRRRTHLCDHRHRRVYTLNGPVRVTSKLAHCPDKSCPGSKYTTHALAESSLALPFWIVGWDVLAWLGHRRFARHWSVAQLRDELADSFRIRLSDDAIERQLAYYSTLLAARHQDPEQLADAYANTQDLVLTIDGLQPERGHETLYVVRELRQQRVWFAEALLSSAERDLKPLFLRAKAWAERLGKPVTLWMTDKQASFVRLIKRVFPGVPHRYCYNHFLRDLTKPLRARDGKMKIQLRKQVRGLRKVERQVLNERARDAEATPPRTSEPGGQVVLDYCATVRGILTDDRSGPLDPGGLRMASALSEVRLSLRRSAASKKGVERQDG